ncbi:MAG TPA: cyclic nucleotide-binding domain-containing protein [Planctomycetota bacterium]|nr:cyclic nucleotide-binding domain-containing protein [Planctomycetota bacterium]
MRVVLHILAELDDGDLHWTLDAGRPLRLPRGRMLLRQGQTVEHLYLLVEGELEMLRGGWSMGRLAPGDVLGEMELLREHGSAADVTAEADALALAVPHAEIRRKVLQDKGFSSRLYRALCLALADRLVRADARNGAAGEQGAAPDGSGELAPGTLEGLALARARFDWLRGRLRGARALP